MAYPMEDLFSRYEAVLTAGVPNAILCGVSLGVGKSPIAGANLLDG
jgi:hypothetical protein